MPPTKWPRVCTYLNNQEVHVWAYHAVAPHVWLDTPLIVQALGIH